MENVERIFCSNSVSRMWTTVGHGVVVVIQDSLLIACQIGTVEMVKTVLNLQLL